MGISNTLGVALKEWHTVCLALGSGRQSILLRKGGISESAGEFEVEHRQFLLFPTYLHQSRGTLKPEAHANYEPHSAEPAQVKLELAAEVTDIIRLTGRAQMDALDAEHIWTPPLIDTRFSYRPANPLYLLIVRAHRLSHAVLIENTPDYAGCKSWVPLDLPIDTTGASPAVSDVTFAANRQRIRAALGMPA